MWICYKIKAANNIIKQRLSSKIFAMNCKKYVIPKDITYSKKY